MHAGPAKGGGGAVVALGAGELVCVGVALCAEPLDVPLAGEPGEPHPASAKVTALAIRRT